MVKKAPHNEKENVAKRPSYGKKGANIENKKLLDSLGGGEGMGDGLLLPPPLRAPKHGIQLAKISKF